MTPQFYWKQTTEPLKADMRRWPIRTFTRWCLLVGPAESAPRTAIPLPDMLEAIKLGGRADIFLEALDHKLAQTELTKDEVITEILLSRVSMTLHRQYGHLRCWMGWDEAAVKSLSERDAKALLVNILTT